MYNPNTYDWYQCDEEDYDSGTPPDEQLATAPIQVDEESTYDEVVAEARAEDERAESEVAQLIAAMRAAVAGVPSYCERYQNGLTLEQELTAFDQKYLTEHGIYPALCDLPEHLIGVATR